MTSLAAAAGRLLGQALDGIAGRWWRSLTTVLVVAVAAGAAVAVPTIARTNEVAITQAFLDTRGDDVVFRLPEPATGVVATTYEIDHLTARDEVQAAAGLAPLHGVYARTALMPGTDGVAVRAVHGDLLGAAGLHVTHGIPWDAEMLETGARVALVGAGAANDLQLGPVDGLTTVLVGGLPYLVIGIVTDTGALGLSATVLLPHRAALADHPMALGPIDIAVVRTAPEDLAPVAEIGARLLAPHQPGLVTTAYSPGAQQLPAIVTAQLGTTTVALAATGAGVAGIVVLVLMSATVSARRAEIGLRRSLGAGRTQVMSQFLIEGSILGAIGAGAGVALGVGVAAVAARGAGPLVIPEGIVLLVLTGVVAASLLACVPPAWRAGAIDPVDALTSAA